MTSPKNISLTTSVSTLFQRNDYDKNISTLLIISFVLIAGFLVVYIIYEIEVRIPKRRKDHEEYNEWLDKIDDRKLDFIYRKLLDKDISLLNTETILFTKI